VRVAKGASNPPSPATASDSQMVVPSPSRRAAGAATTAPARNPTLPSSNTNPISPGPKCSWWTMNRSKTGVMIPLKKFDVPVAPAMRRSTGCRRT